MLYPYYSLPVPSPFLSSYLSSHQTIPSPSRHLLPSLHDTCNTNQAYALPPDTLIVRAPRPASHQHGSIDRFLEEVVG